MTAGPNGSSQDQINLAPRVQVRSIFARFWPDTKPLRGPIAAVLLLVAAGPALTTVVTWLFKVLIDEVVVPGDFRLFPRLAGVFVGLVLIQAVVSFGDHYLTVWTGERFTLALRARLFRHLHRLTPDFLERRSLGDVLTRLTGDITAIEQLLISGVAQAVSSVLELIFFTVALVLLDWRLTLAALIAAPAFLFVSGGLARRIQNAAREKSRRVGGIAGVAEESLGNAALVRAYHRGEFEARRFEQQNQAGFTAQMAATRLEALFEPLTDVLEVIGILAVIGLAVWEVAHHRLSVGGLLAFVAYLGQMYGPIQGFGMLSNAVFAASASAERVIELLDQQPSIVEPAKPRALRHARGAVRFHQVNFAYPGAERPTVVGMDFTVQPGQTIALVGASGAGKSTIAKLLLRFYDPDSGAVSIDGVNLPDLSLDDLYRNVAAVLQETLVFDGTIRENIQWGKPDASEEQIVQAAIAADAHGFISAFPDGYHTRVGQRGRLLSGGQRQRVAIARAMIRDAPVLILDEPTTGLDVESSQRVLSPLRRLMAGRTTILISHNLLTVTEADHILMLEQGHVIALGTHHELLATYPDYAQLYRLHQPLSAPGTPQPAAYDATGTSGLD
jgi:ABC-type multidrug transport system fused ATPase/permease subunit